MAVAHTAMPSAHAMTSRRAINLIVFIMMSPVGPLIASLDSVFR
jgi:hypothetical protein